MSYEAHPTALDARTGPAMDLSVGSLRAARAAITIVFLANGTEIGLWAAYIPLLKETHHLSEQRLGFVLLGFALGAIATMTMTGWLTARWNSGRVMVVAGALCAAALSLPALAPSVAAFAASAVLLGAANGAMDISMNAHASALERVWRAHIMSSFHAFFSLGGLLGAAAGSLLIARGFDAPSGLPLASLVLVLDRPRHCPDRLANDEARGSRCARSRVGVSNVQTVACAGGARRRRVPHSGR